MSSYVYVYLLIELVAVSWGDVKHKKIPHVWNLLNIITFIFLVIFLPFEYTLGLSTFFYSLAFFIVGFLLFTLNIMGGGDSKFLATFFLLVPATRHGEFLTIMLYGTILVAGSLFFYHSVKNLNQLWAILMTRTWEQLPRVYNKKFAFAPLILFSWLIFGYMIKVWE